MGHELGQPGGKGDIAQEPDGAAPQQVLQLDVKIELATAADLVVERIDEPVQRHEIEAVARQRIGAGDLGHPEAGQLLQPPYEIGPAAIDQMLATTRAMISRRSRWPPISAAGYFFAHAAREIVDEVALEMRLVGNAAGNDVGDQHDLGIGQQHADLGARQRLAARLALGERQRVGQRLDGTVEQAARPPAPS